MTISHTTSLQGQFLVAMPKLADSEFDRALIYMIEHNEEGAMGLVINQPIDMTVDEILEQVDAEYTFMYHPQMALCGGPVENTRGFILHRTRPDRHWVGEMPLNNGLSVTASADILNAMIRNDDIGPYLFALGYSGWAAGQLENEMLDNAWLSIPASVELLFSTEPEHLLECAVRELGISYSQLSNVAGHA